MTPEESGSAAALAVAERFFTAVLYGDRRGLWSLFTPSARRFILRRGREKGLPAEVAEMILAGDLHGSEAEVFLADLMAGIRRDLEAVDLGAVALSSVAEPHAPLQVKVTFLQTLGEGPGPTVAAFPAGSLLLALDGDEWKVDRLQVGAP
jgi:hypothetical protein